MVSWTSLKLMLCSYRSVTYWSIAQARTSNGKLMTLWIIPGPNWMKCEEMRADTFMNETNVFDHSELNNSLIFCILVAIFLIVCEFLFSVRNFIFYFIFFCIFSLSIWYVYVWCSVFVLRWPFNILSRVYRWKIAFWANSGTFTVMFINVHCPCK